jgi:integrase
MRTVTELPNDVTRVTDAQIRDLRLAPGKSGYTQRWVLGPGLGLEFAAGLSARSFRAITYDHNGATVRQKLGRWHPDEFAFADAIKAAWKVKDSPEVQEANRATFGTVAERYYSSQIEGKAITVTEVRRKLDKYILPVLGTTKLAKVTRGAVANFLDSVETAHGAAQANSCLTTVAAILNHHALKTDGYSAPLLRKLKKKTRAGQGRTRVLDAVELRKVWKAAGNGKTPAQKAFNNLVRLAILTAQRREKLMTLKYTDLDRDYVWTIRRTGHPNEKGTPKKLRLPLLAMEVILYRPRPRGSEFVFDVKSMGRFKAWLDQDSGVYGWTIHDLRRTTRTFLSKAAVGVDYVVAEKLLGHKLGTAVARVYEHHDFYDELAAALESWANYLQTVILPEPAMKVTKLEPKAA